MSKRGNSTGRVIGILVLAGFVLLAVWSAMKPPKAPVTRRFEQAIKDVEATAGSEALKADARLVRQLLEEKLDERRFAFPTIVLAASGKKVIPLDPKKLSHQRVIKAIEDALKSSIDELNLPGSPVHELRRINEGSRHFEEALLEKLDQSEGISCGHPLNREGRTQRSGYPDLRIVDEESGGVFYLDPKLVESGSLGSTLRSFYFEPKERTLKITDDAVHLLVGIEHDGKLGEWTFSDWKLVDLSKLEVRLKAEFQASNADLYGDPASPP